MDKLLEQQVRRRAGGACEYCRIPAFQCDQPFHMDHVSGAPAFAQVN